MTGFFSKIFGQKSKLDTQVEDLLKGAIEGIISSGGFKLDYSIKGTEEEIVVDLKGEDAGLVVDRDGQLLDGMQTYLKRLLQNKMPQKMTEVVVDCDGYLERASEELRDLADQLKHSALERGQASFVRPLPPRDRKVIHRHLASDTRVKSQSIGEGFCKKIKISPVGISPRQHSGENRYKNNGRRNHSRGKQRHSRNHQQQHTSENNVE